MHRTRLLLVLPLFALLSPAARAGSATPPDDATAVVEKQLVKPLADKEARQSRFSRAYIPPQARRVRILDTGRSTDSRGAEFVAFAVDQRSGVLPRRGSDDSAGWRKNAIVGCVYPARDEVFVKRGDKFFAAGLLLGKRTPAAGDTVCRAATAQAPSASGIKAHDIAAATSTTRRQ